ncbi:DUF1987 domain-containing protein [Marichromatium bheemlicum]|uniref:DUF1987 domain-containing protein n=1 Tax=Marichromatium bheemlicum TaxID=365339 RepID=A0ABX1ICY1_9GAMM|nr:DUF1987 domain-containing protein [Marichromatium bheemlicum]NKN34047.1 DUF1987 domain-containing protein [Marichromatium bheemlicum]
METLETLYRAPTERSPLLEFDFTNRRLRIEGESYPEDAAAFYGPVIQALETFLAAAVAAPDATVRFELRMSYFNSSSAKALMNIFQRLEAAAATGVGVHIRWHYHVEDDTMQEFGEDFSEDFAHAVFELCEFDDD